jgi:hypothetical protein
VKKEYPMDVLAKALHCILDTEGAHDVDCTLAHRVADLAEKEQEPGRSTMIADGMPQVYVDRRRKLVAVTDPVVLCEKQLGRILTELRGDRK